MIRFSFSSFYMSLIFANIMILFLYIAFHSQKLMIKLGLSILSGAAFLTILRMVLPFEFLFLSNNIYFPDALSIVISEFLHPRFFNDRFSIWTFAMIIWFIGIFYKTYFYVRAEYYCSKDVKKYSMEVPESSQLSRVFKKIQEEIPKARRIEIRIFPFIQAPAIYGLRKHYILFPENLQLTDKQLYYIFRHETAHYLHHDVLLKLCVRFLCIVYWWNPFSGFLQKKLDEILEMRVDKTITKEHDKKVEYLQCLVYVADCMTKPNTDINNSTAISFYSDFSSNLKTRFNMLMNDEVKPFYKFKKNVLLILFTALFCLSYIFIFEASYIPPEDSAGKFIPDKTNTYIIERKDGLYDFYMNGDFAGTENSIEYYPDDIPIYKEGGEAK